MADNTIADDNAWFLCGTMLQAEGALFDAPYEIPSQNADAWMVQELRAGMLGRVSGKVRCADMLDKPEHWRE